MLRPDLVRRKLHLAEEVAASAGLRNILVHEYNDVDHRVLHDGAIPGALERYLRYVREVEAAVDAIETR